MRTIISIKVHENLPSLMLRNRTRKKVAKIKAEEEEAKKPKTIPHWKKHFQNEKELQEDTAKKKVSFSFSKHSLANTDAELPDVDIEKDADLTEVSLNSENNKAEDQILSNKFIQEIKEHEQDSILELNNIKLYMVNEGGYKNAKDILFYNIII